MYCWVALSLSASAHGNPTTVLAHHLWQMLDTIAQHSKYTHVPQPVILLPSFLLESVKICTIKMAKDVTTFLSWAAEPEHDERKRMGFQWVSAMVIAAGLAGYYKRFRWAPLKTRKISYHK